MPLTTKELQNLLTGLAIGDAFGAGVEFQDRDRIRREVDFTRFVNLRHEIPVPGEKLAAFTENYHGWDYTDDTEMTIGVIKALLSDEPFSEDLLVHHWKAEYDFGKEKKGFGRNGHGSMSWYYSGEMTIDQIRDFQRDRPNPGNAPAMRSIPLGFVHEDKINRYAEINANASHPNPLAVMSSQCVAWAAHYLLVKQGDPSDLIKYCRDRAMLNQEYRDYFKAIAQLPDYDQLSEADFATLCGPQPIAPPYFLPGIKGCPSDSKYTTGCVLYILQQSQDAFDALKKSVQLGGDVDSVASLTTGIMAAKTGLDSLPEYMLNAVEGRSYLNQLAGHWWTWIAGNSNDGITL